MQKRNGSGQHLRGNAQMPYVRKIRFIIGRNPTAKDCTVTFGEAAGKQLASKKPLVKQAAYAHYAFQVESRLPLFGIRGQVRGQEEK